MNTNAAQQSRQATDAQMNLFSDLLVVYLLVGSALGDCELYRRMGRALALNDDTRMRAALEEFEELSRPLKERIMRGDPHFKAPDLPLRRQQPRLSEDRPAAPAARAAR